MTRHIALLGLSGVGKSTLIGQLNERIAVLHLQASALIKDEQAYRAQQPDDSEALRLGAIADNQALMIAAYRRVVASTELPVVFDGHSVIDGRDGLVEVAPSVFVDLELDAIFYLSADPHIIAERRRADVGRDRPTRDAETLAEQQRIAENVARRIAGQIDCTFIAITDSDVDRLAETLRRP